MTKKDFIALAAVLRPYCESKIAHFRAQARLIAMSVADVCAHTNPRFDRARFLAACGVPTGEG